MPVISPAALQLPKGLIVHDNWMIVRALRRAQRPGDADVWLVRRGYRLGVLYVGGFGWDEVVTQIAQVYSQRSATILRRLSSHARVPSFVTEFQLGGRHAFIRDYLSGPPLSAIVKRQGRIPWHIAARYALDLAHLIAYQQALGVSCRDIKPDNVVIQGGRAIVFDYNVAGGPCCPFPPGWDEPSGTPGFSPPEQLRRGAPVYGGDTWSLMATLFFMLAGRCPFLYEGEDPQLIDAAVLLERSASHSFPLALPDTVPQRLCDLIILTIGRPLAASPSADLVIDELRRALRLPILRW